MGRAITVSPPSLIWRTIFLPGSTPYVVYPRVNAAPNGEMCYGFQITPNQLPPSYNTAGRARAGQRRSEKGPATTVMDINRTSRILAALAPSHSFSG